jgi:hypothetical protein
LSFPFYRDPFKHCHYLDCLSNLISSFVPSLSSDLSLRSGKRQELPFSGKKYEKAKWRRAGLPDGFIFKPQIPIWVKLGGPWNGKCFYIL